MVLQVPSRSSLHSSHPPVPRRAWVTVLLPRGRRASRSLPSRFQAWQGGKASKQALPMRADPGGSRRGPAGLPRGGPRSDGRRRPPGPWPLLPAAPPSQHLPCLPAPRRPKPTSRTVRGAITEGSLPSQAAHGAHPARPGCGGWAWGRGPRCQGDAEATHEA